MRSAEEKRWQFYGENPDAVIFENPEYEYDGGILHFVGISAAAVLMENAEKISVCAVAGRGISAGVPGVGEYGVQPVQSGCIFRAGPGNRGRYDGVFFGI